MKTLVCLFMCMQAACVLCQTINFLDQYRGMKYANPDTKGYRYCAYWKLPDGMNLYSSCDPFTMERCGRPASFDYKCCPGFQEGHETYSFPGCSRIISPYRTCAEALSFSETHRALIAPQLAQIQELDSLSQPYTIFASSVFNGSDEYGPPNALQHIIKGRFYANDLRDGMKLKTLDKSRSLYVSHYSYGVTAIDCVELTDVDLECSSGLIHNIRHSLNIPSPSKISDRSSVMALLQAHPETKLFTEDLPPSLKKSLQHVNSGKRYTVLAPQRQVWESVRRKYSGNLLSSIAVHHVLENQVCAAELVHGSNMKQSIDGEPVEIICNLDQHQKERRQVRAPCGDKISLLKTDITAENGVVHLVDQPIIPLSAYSMEKFINNKNCAEKMKIKEFLKLMQECDIKMEENESYVIIMPQDESFQWWSTYKNLQREYRRFQMDKEYRCRVARYHIVLNNANLRNIFQFTGSGRAHRSSNKNNFLYQANYFKRTKYGPQLNFHYSPIPDLRAIELSSVSIYLTTRINVIPEENITDILKRLPNTRITNQKTLEADMNGKYFEKLAPNNLYLVSTDDGWKEDISETSESTGPYRLEYTIYRNHTLEKFLLLHHVPQYLWGGDIGYFDKNSVHKIMSSAGQELTFYMDGEGLMRIGYDSLPLEKWPRAVRFNIPARDGIIWLLDGIIKCPENICPPALDDVDSYAVYVAACQTVDLPGETNIRNEFEIRPADVAKRHLDKCTVLLQFEGQSVKEVDIKTLN